MAPFYDLLCTAVYHTRLYSNQDTVWPNEKLASPIVGANFFSEVTYEKLIAIGLDLGLPKSSATREVGKLADAADELIAKLESAMRDPSAAQGAPTR